MTLIHKRSHGGASSPQLLEEAFAQHKRLQDAVIANFGNRERREKAAAALRHHWIRLCRREMRLEMQREQEHVKALLPTPDLDNNEGNW